MNGIQTLWAPRFETAYALLLSLSLPLHMNVRRIGIRPNPFSGPPNPFPLAATRNATVPVADDTHPPRIVNNNSNISNNNNSQSNNNNNNRNPSVTPNPQPPPAVVSPPPRPPIPVAEPPALLPDYEDLIPPELFEEQEERESDSEWQEERESDGEWEEYEEQLQLEEEELRAAKRRKAESRIREFYRIVPRAKGEASKPSEPSEGQRGSGTCLGCTERRMLLCYAPCGHQCMCAECHEKEWIARGKDQCPLCRGKVICACYPVAE